MGIPISKIFCSSIIGQGLENGEQFNDKIHSCINSTKVIIYYISNNFVQSSYCMAELGIGWNLEKLGKVKILIILDDDFSLDLLSGFINKKIYQFSKINLENTAEIIDCLGKYITLPKISKAQATSAINSFVEEHRKISVTTKKEVLKKVKAVDTKHKNELKKQEKSFQEEKVKLLKQFDEDVSKLIKQFQSEKESLEKTYKELLSENLKEQKETVNKQLYNYNGTILNCIHIRRARKAIEGMGKSFWFDIINERQKLGQSLGYSDGKIEGEFGLDYSFVYDCFGMHNEAYTALYRYVKTNPHSFIHAWMIEHIFKYNFKFTALIAILNENMSKLPPSEHVDSTLHTVDLLIQHDNDIEKGANK